MSAPLISVVVPTFNRAYCVSNAIESVFAQTFKNIEVIVVDDGSTDNTLEILARFGDRIRLIRQKNSGVSTARNTGVRAARGGWIAFLDSDDRWHPDKLERQAGYLQKYAAKICFTRCVTDYGVPLPDIEDVPSILKEPELHYVEDVVDLVCSAQGHPYMQSMLIEKHLFEKVGLFDESLQTAGDTQLLFKLSFFSGLIYIDSPLVVVHRTLAANSLTYDLNPETAKKRFSSYLRVQAEMYWRLLEVHPEKISVVRDRLGYFISRRAELACVTNQPRHARAIARNGIFFAGDLRTFVRCAGIFLFPRLLQPWFRKKWSAGGKRLALPNQQPASSGGGMGKNQK